MGPKLDEFMDTATKTIGTLADEQEKTNKWMDAAEKELKGVRELLRHGGVGGGDPIPPSPHRVFSSDRKAEDFGKYLIGVAQSKALDGQTDETGAVLVPQEFRSEILRYAENYSRLLNICRKVPVRMGKTTYPRAAGGPTVYWVGAGTEITESDVEIEPVDLMPERLAALVGVDNALLNDAMIPDVGNYLAVEFARAINKEIERVLTNGTGIAADGKITGILQSDHVTIVNMAATKTGFTDLAWDNIVDLEAAVIDSGLDEARYVLSRSILAVVKKIKDNGGLPIWHAPAGPEPSTINGHPYTLTPSFPVQGDSAAATPFIAFGQMQAVMVGMVGNGMAVDSSAHWKFSKHQTYFRAMLPMTALVVPGEETAKNPIASLTTAAE